ncbi:VOC family protein [Pectinatus frisingensis]|jgi:predicted enzyme related to lactoylglutathione lyase|uniref:VOC family protein n=1 Tax=Pectinatus frisingensis TaxID=865 RepID=UPI0015F48765|nr:VOC family protein [Pectinatus frisingensis]
MPKEIELGDLMLDCDNEERLSDFYHKLLGWKKHKMFGHPAVSSENGLTLLFVEDNNYIPPIWPEEKGRQQKQMHLNFEVNDLAAAVHNAELYGAVKAKNQFGGSQFITFFDPSGHPFCLCAKHKS